MLVFSPRIRVFFRFVLFHWVLFSLLRAAFYFLFSGASGSLKGGEVLHALYIGAKFDLRASLWLLLPLLLFSWFPGLNLRKSIHFWVYSYSVLAVGWFLLYLADFGYFSYLNTRINASFLNFFYNPMISAGMVWQNYPVIKGVLGIVAFLYVYQNLMRRYILRQQFFPVKMKSLKNALGVLVFTAFFVGGMYGKWGYYPLRWSEAFFSTKTFVSALALNPVLYFSSTMRHRELNYDIEKVKKSYDMVADYLGVKDKDAEKLNLSRYIPPSSNAFDFKPNVVVIVMESYAAYKTALMNNPLDAGPNLSAVAREGVWFPDYYVPVEGTARSMFAIMTGVPDLSKNKTASRNPLIVNQNVIMNAFRDYKKFYFLGGSANWGNIRGVFSNNIKDIEIVEEGEFKEERTDVWGLSDYHLFKEADRRLSLVPQDQAFVAVIQSSSYHRPYTIPTDNGGFVYLEKSEEELKNAGFISNEEYNSFRFADFSLGKFFEWAREREWFENTLFVITGDHGVPDNAAPFQDPARREFETAPFHVPLVFYNKKIFPNPRVEKKTATEMDVFPSIAGLLGLEHYNFAMGRNLFDTSFDDRRYALTYTYHRPGEYGLIGEGYYLKVKPGGRSLFSILPNSNLQDLKDAEKDRFQYMSDLVDGLLHVGRYMLHNNHAPEATPKESGE